MSDETGEVRIFDEDPERVVSATVGELQELCTWAYGCGHDFVGMSDATIHELTCHFVFRDESYSTPYGCEQDGAYYCSACGCDLPDWMQEHVDDIHAGKVDNDIDRCPICGARVVDE